MVEKFVDYRKLRHGQRKKEIKDRIKDLIPYGLSFEVGDFETILKVEKERFGTDEGCGCPQCAKSAVHRANEVIYRIVRDPEERDRLRYYIDKRNDRLCISTWGQHFEVEEHTIEDNDLF